MKTVFVVDDDGLMLELVRRTLEREGFCARTFISAAAACEALESEQPDLVISDVNMPEIDGFRLAELIAERPDPVPVIMMTGEPTPEAEGRAQRLGVRLMRKPIRDLSPLLEWVNEAIGGSQDDLEAIRFEFLVGISHELRTPLTALKLAFGALAAGIPEDPDDRDHLVEIGRRSLDRLARHVDAQLKLLEHLLLSERAVRRSVSIEEAVGDAAGPGLALNGSSQTRVLTDVDRLQAVIRHLVEPRGRTAVRFDINVTNGERAELIFENAQFTEANGQMDSSAGEGSTTPLWNPSALSFEERACTRIVESIGGRLFVDEKATRIELPIATDDSARAVN